VEHHRRFQVVDVTVSHEDAGYQEEHHNSKVAKYKPIFPQLETQLELVPGKMLPVDIGTRGTIPKSTLSSLEEFRITDRDSDTTLALLAPRNSIETHHWFIEYDKTPGLPTSRSADSKLALTLYLYVYKSF
jgi:hypothetical protein